MIEVLPATAERFQDVSSILSPGKPGSAACWCLSYRIPGGEFNALTGKERPARLRRFAEEGTPPGVIAYVEGEPAGWCSVSPRAGHHRLVRSRTIPTVDDVPAWSIICFVIRPPFRRRGLTVRLLDGAVNYARASGAPAVEAYPADPGDGRISSPLAYVGTSGLFESAGFERVLETASKSGGLTRWLMRRNLAS